MAEDEDLPKSALTTGTCAWPIALKRAAANAKEIGARAVYGSCYRPRRGPVGILRSGNQYTRERLADAFRANGSKAAARQHEKALAPLVSPAQKSVHLIFEDSAQLGIYGT